MTDASRLDALARTLDAANIGSLQTIRRGTITSAGATPPQTPPVGIATARSAALRSPLAIVGERPPEPAPDDTALPRVAIALPEAPDTTADLELVSILGRGGMGAVWLGRQRSLRREVAVKRMNADAMSEIEALALISEARAAGALEHPNILPIHAIGMDGEGSPLLVMKRVEGVTLDALCHDRDHPGWPDLLRRHEDRLGVIVEVLMRVADALHFAHTRGYVHRDIKPENVMIGAFGETHLLDWGLAVNLRDDDAVAADGLVGTPAFMAPEMVFGQIREIDARTDVYLLGATLHGALTGRPRHEGDKLHAVLMAALSSAPVDYGPEVPGELALLANRATSANPNQRPPSALAFRDALADFVRHRASRRLSERALGLLARLGEAVEARTSADGGRVLLEARFGFTQALREWDGNEEARSGLRTTLLRLAEAELARRSPEAAAAIASELEPRDAELDSRIEALRAELAQARRLEEAARAEARERDPTMGRQTRTWFGIVITALVSSILAFIGWQRLHGSGLGVSDVVLPNALLAMVGIAVLTFFRRTLLANRWGRHMLGIMLLMILMPLACNAVALLRGAGMEIDTPYSMLVTGGICGTAALTLSRRMVWASATWIAGSFVAAKWAWTATPLQAIAVIALSIALAIEVRARRSEQ